MQELMVRPEIFRYGSVKEFVADFEIGVDDLVITNTYIYQPYFEALHPACQVLFQETYGSGEPSDEMVEAMYRDVLRPFSRVIAIGGGTVIDIAKLFALKDLSPVLDLYDGKRKPVKEKKLVILPTTCGTGSEVTNISILALNSRGTKKGLADDALYADRAVLIPELLAGLPFSVFASSSMDALIHAIESSLSPKGNDTTRMFGYRAIWMILSGYLDIALHGKDARFSWLEQFLLASTYAGIAFGNAGCGAVHALSYPLGAVYHVPHGEANYAMFTGVMKKYMEIKTDGQMAVLNAYMAGILSCEPAEVYSRLEELLGVLIEKKTLQEYGMTETQIESFADSVWDNQQRLLANNFVPLDREQIAAIYRSLYR